ncbi:MAG: sigma-70 family RNA polymerase sigma factor, partial [Granulosicoccus sp.]|nr:sigma-70 family RNA polymerase sigma factor [Granulosicoccus sp.]
MSTSEQMLQQIVRADWSRLMSAVVRDIKDIELAEDVLADALESALVHWGKHGVPEAPHGWLIRTARRKAIDRIRRDQNFAAKQIEYAYLLELDRIQEPETEPAIADEQLALMFTCAHPALNEAARVALVLQVVSGIPTAAIAKAFMVEEAAMAQRLVRAKRKIRGAGVPFLIPEPELWDERL